MRSGNAGLIGGFVTGGGLRASNGGSFSPLISLKFKAARLMRSWGFGGFSWRLKVKVKVDELKGAEKDFSF